MTVNFLFNNDSFENDDKELEYVYTRIDELDILRSKIDDINEKKRKIGLEKDKLLKDFDIYNKNIYHNLTVSDFINNYTEVSRDYKVLLGSIINKSGNFVDENIDGQIGLFEIPEHLIYRIDDLIKFYYKNFEKFVKSRNLNFIEYDNLDDAIFIQKIKDLQFDVAIVCSFNYKIPKILLEAVKDGFINAHPSLLPKYRGSNP